METKLLLRQRWRSFSFSVRLKRNQKEATRLSQSYANRVGKGKDDILRQKEKRMKGIMLLRELIKLERVYL